MFSGAVSAGLFLLVLTSVIGSIPSYASLIFGFGLMLVFSLLRVEEDFTLSEEEIEDGVVD